MRRRAEVSVLIMLLGGGCAATKSDVETALDERVVSETKRICSAIPNCADAGGRRVQASDLRGMSDGWYVAPLGLKPEPGNFVDASGNPASTQCGDLISSESSGIRRVGWTDQLETSGGKEDAVKRQSSDDRWSPFASGGVFYRIARTAIRTGLDVSVPPFGIAVSGQESSISTQLWRKLDERSLKMKPGYAIEHVRACCAAYGCETGVLVTAVAKWQRMAFDFADAEATADGRYALALTASGQVDWSRAKFIDETYYAVRLDPGFRKAGSAGDICPSPSTGLSINKADESTWEFSINCRPGFKVSGGGEIEVIGTGLGTKVRLKNPGNPTTRALLSLMVVPDGSGPFAQMGSPASTKLELQYSVVDTGQNVGIATLIQAARYRPVGDAPVMKSQRCASATDTVSFRPELPDPKLQVTPKTIWIADGSVFRVATNEAPLSTDEVRVRCLDLAPASKQICRDTSDKPVELAVLFEVTDKKLGSPLATVPGRFTVNVDNSLYCIAPSAAN